MASSTAGVGAGAPKRILVIGAGPSGLVAAKTLVEHGYHVEVVEASRDIGGTFVNKAYDDGMLVSSRHITAFSDYRMPWGRPLKDHPSVEEYVEYLGAYCQEFGLRRLIRFGTLVRRVAKRRLPTDDPVWKHSYMVTMERKGDGTARTTATEERHYDAVCVCSGLHNVPAEPNVPGLRSDFAGKVLHSSTYKQRDIFAGQRVLVVGAGETGLDLAYRAVQARATEVTLAVRRGFLSVPTVIKNGVALDTLITNLFECSYQHDWVEYLKLKWRFTTPFIRLAFLLGTGSSGGYNQWAGCLPDVKRGYHIINKSTQAMPFINRPLKQKSFLGRHLYHLLDDEQDPTLPDVDVKVAAPVRVSGPNTVEFSDGTTRDFDVVVMATGYRQRFPFLFGGRDSEAGDDPLPEQRNICTADEPTMGFFGFVRPNVGAIPCMSEMQVMWWVRRLQGHIRAPLKPPTYQLLGGNPRTSNYSCDYGAYMHDLARDIGCVPNVAYWAVTQPKVAIAYCLGQAYVTFFRLQGPFAHADAPRVASQELFRPVVDRGLGANVLFMAIILLFGVINLGFWLLELCTVRPLRAVGLLRPAMPR